MWRLLTSALCVGCLFLEEVVVRSLAGKSIGGAWGQGCSWWHEEGVFYFGEALSGTWKKWAQLTTVWNKFRWAPCSRAWGSVVQLCCGFGELLRAEPLCRTLGNLNFQEWNLHVETWGTWCEVSGRLPQTTPKLYWKNRKLFKLLGKILALVFLVNGVWKQQITLIFVYPSMPRRTERLAQLRQFFDCFYNWQTCSSSSSRLDAPSGAGAFTNLTIH